MKKIILFSTIFSIVLFSCNTEKTTDEKNKINTTDTTAAFAPEALVPKKDSIPEGKYEERHPNGLIKTKGEYAGGKRHGIWLSFYPEGNVWSECAYKNGVKEGQTITYYPNGNKRYEGFYTNDKESGIWKYWEENGKLSKEIDHDKK